MSHRNPLFADTALAARIEKAECRLVGDCAEAISRARPQSGVFVRPIAGGLATCTEPGSPLNKVAGLGFGGPVEDGELDEIEAAFARHDTPVQVELSNLADPSIGAQLTRRGYQLIGFENVVGLPLSAHPAQSFGVEQRAGQTAECFDHSPSPGARVADPPEPAKSSREPSPRIEIWRSGHDTFAEWLEIVIRGFATPDTQGVPSHESYPREVIERIVTDMVSAPGFMRYIATRDGVPAGGASMRVWEGTAHLCGAATLPEHRRRGIQTALLATRLREAAELGCDLAVMMALPGSKSQQNAQRHGFCLLYTRAILVKPLAGGNPTSMKTAC